DPLFLVGANAAAARSKCIGQFERPRERWEPDERVPTGWTGAGCIDFGATEIGSATAELELVPERGAPARAHLSATDRIAAARVVDRVARRELPHCGHAPARHRPF